MPAVISSHKVTRGTSLHGTRHVTQTQSAFSCLRVLAVRTSNQSTVFALTRCAPALRLGGLKQMWNVSANLSLQLVSGLLVRWRLLAGYSSRPIKSPVGSSRAGTGWWRGTDWVLPAPPHLRLTGGLQ